MLSGYTEELSSHRLPALQPPPAHRRCSVRCRRRSKRGRRWHRSRERPHAPLTKAECCRWCMSAAGRPDGLRAAARRQATGAGRRQAALPRPTRWTRWRPQARRRRPVPGHMTACAGCPISPTGHHHPVGGPRRASPGDPRRADQAGHRGQRDRPAAADGQHLHSGERGGHPHLRDAGRDQPDLREPVAVRRPVHR